MIGPPANGYYYGGTRTKGTTRWYPSVPISDARKDWTSSFDAAFNHDKCKLEFRVKIQLYKVGDTPVDLDAMAANWKKAIAGAYNKWKLMPKYPKKCCECKAGIRLNFRAEFVTSWTWTDNYEVAVDGGKAKGKRAKLCKWYAGSSSFSREPFHGVIHEVGHMFGLLDEYRDWRAPKRVFI